MKSSDLPLDKRIRFRIFGRVYLEHRQHEGWSGSNPFYLVNCPEHGPYEDYPHGYREELRCPKCEEKPRDRNRVVGSQPRRQDMAA